MSSSTAFRISAALGFLAVALGAFGAHGLEELLAKNERLHNWETAVRYHFVHMLIMCFLAIREPFQRGPWTSFLIGIIVFSGTLYTLAITNIKWLGAITPVGGIAFLIGWGWLVFSGLKQPPNTNP